MAVVKNTAITGFPFELLNSVTGDPITTGAVTAFYVLDGGVQTAMSGTATHEGNGQWSWDTIPAAATNGDWVGLLFIHAEGRASFTIKTTASPYGELIAGTPSEVELCNLALLDLGADPIESLTDDSDRARLCRHLYPACRDELLVTIQPHAAVRRSLLAATTTPTFGGDQGWTYAFAIPTGCLLPLDTDDEAYPWQREGNTLLATRTPVYLRYVYRLEDVTKYPYSFSRALVAYLAARMAYPITKSTSLMEQKYKLYEMAKDEALAIEGQEGSPAILRVPTLTDNVRG